MSSQFSFEENSYNEDAAVAYIRSELPKEINDSITDDDDILCVIDLIWDYYEKKGMLSFDNLDEEDELLDVADLIKYARRRVNEDEELSLSATAIELIVKSELDYEKSLEGNI